jgi:hypothetical protein
MPVKIKTQKDYLLTEVNIELPADLAALDAIMKATKATGKIVAVYNQGGVLGVNIEQRTKATDADAVKVRDILGVETKSL